MGIAMMPPRRKTRPTCTIAVVGSNQPRISSRVPFQHEHPSNSEQLKAITKEEDKEIPRDGSYMHINAGSAPLHRLLTVH
jgi:hypothetical protein